MFNRVFAVGFLALATGLAVTPGHAAPLNLIPKSPDITATYIDVAYNHVTLQFTATGWATDLDVDNVPPPDYAISMMSANFNLAATISNAGHPLGGTLSITGTIPALGALSGTLLTGTLWQFGYPDPPGGEVFEFIFNTTGGDLAAMYGSHIGVILSALDTGFGGSFANSFANTGLGVADAFVPSPAAALGGMALLMCMAMMKSQRRKGV